MKKMSRDSVLDIRKYFLSRKGAKTQRNKPEVPWRLCGFARKVFRQARQAALYLLLYVFLQLFSPPAKAQNGTITAGFQYKPIFSTSLLKTNPDPQTINNIDFKIDQRSGHCVGMVVRRSFTNKLSFETGINYTKRKYRLTIKDTTYTNVSQFSAISYEIPALFLVYIRLGKVYMNASMGAVLDMFASDLISFDTTFVQTTNRKNLFKPGLLANLGYEYRTKKAGYFYFGVSYHRPFGDIYNSQVIYRTKTEMNTGLSGSYLTVDFRYFFKEDPLKKKERKTKKKTSILENKDAN